jgi:hypothetical protein
MSPGPIANGPALPQVFSAVECRLAGQPRRKMEDAIVVDQRALSEIRQPGRTAAQFRELDVVRA